MLANFTNFFHFPLLENCEFSFFFFILSQKKGDFCHSTRDPSLHSSFFYFLPSLLMLTLNSHHLCVQYYIHGQRSRRRWRWSIFPYRPRGIFWWGSNRGRKKRREKNFFARQNGHFEMDCVYAKHVCGFLQKKIKKFLAHLSINIEWFLSFFCTRWDAHAMNH